MRSSLHQAVLFLACATIPFSACSAQEIAALDLTKIDARVDLRRPRATSEISVGYSGAESANYCPLSKHKTGGLRTSLVSLDRADYQIGDELTFEVTVQNIGSVPIRIPFSPHLADLQPSDPAEKFSYYELQIALWIAGDGWWTTAGGAMLYGADSHANTVLTVKPGEWVRLAAKGNLQLDHDVLELIKSGFPADHAYAKSSLLREETLITPRHSATVATEVCVAQTEGQSVPMHLTVP
jgi:hypothetical protein